MAQFVHFKRDITRTQIHSGELVTARRFHSKVLICAAIAFVVTQCAALCRQMLGHKKHVSVVQDYRRFLGTPDFYQWLVISGGIVSDRDVPGLYGPYEEDAT